MTASAQSTATVEGAAWAGAEQLARQAGLIPERADEVEVPYEFANRITLESALVAISAVYGVAAELACRWFARRWGRMPSRIGDAKVPIGSRIGSGI